MASSAPTQEPWNYGWICHLCSKVNHCNYKNSVSRVRKSPWRCCNTDCDHAHTIPPSDAPLPYSNGCDDCDEVVYVAPSHLKGMRSLRKELKLMDGKVAVKQIGWACSWCAKLLDFGKVEGRHRQTRTCKECGLRKANEWYRVVSIKHVAGQEELDEDGNDMGESVGEGDGDGGADGD